MTELEFEVLKRMMAVGLFVVWMVAAYRCAEQGKEIRGLKRRLVAFEDGYQGDDSAHDARDAQSGPKQHVSGARRVFELIFQLWKQKGQAAGTEMEEQKVHDHCGGLPAPSTTTDLPEDSTSAIHQPAIPSVSSSDEGRQDGVNQVRTELADVVGADFLPVSCRAARAMSGALTPVSPPEGCRGATLLRRGPARRLWSSS